MGSPPVIAVRWISCRANLLTDFMPLLRMQICVIPDIRLLPPVDAKPLRGPIQLAGFAVSRRSGFRGSIVYKRLTVSAIRGRALLYRLSVTAICSKARQLHRYHPYQRVSVLPYKH